MFKELVGVDGRINRLGYLSRVVLASVAQGVAFGALLIGPIGLAIFVVLYIPAIVVGFCTTVRRVHDFGSSGWLILWVAFPFVNIIIAFMLLFRSGTQGPNNHGDRPDGLHVGRAR